MFIVVYSRSFLMKCKKISLLCPFKVQLFADTKKLTQTARTMDNNTYVLPGGRDHTKLTYTLYVVAMQTVIEHHKIINKLNGKQFANLAVFLLYYKKASVCTVCQVPARLFM